MTTLTDSEIAAFDGLEESYRIMEAEIIKHAPRCHFSPMMDEGDDYENWWECSVCGHTKARNDK